MDQLAADYASDPVVFIEYDAHNPPPSRSSIWWAGYGPGSTYYPMIMVDSGHQLTSGPENYYSVYQGMVEAELARPPQAEVDARWVRTGDSLRVYVHLKNISGVTLDQWTNSAKVTVIVYEDIHTNDTGRLGRAVATTGISSLASGSSATYTIDLDAIPAENWDNLHVVALADYRPDPSGAYDMLQAAAATPLLPFHVEPETRILMVNVAEMTVPDQTVHLYGDTFFTWTAASNVPWLSPVPASGDMNTPAVFSIDESKIFSGWQEGTLTYSTIDGLFSDTVVVELYDGLIWQSFIPLITR